jgi:hypothetical protein
LFCAATVPNEAFTLVKGASIGTDTVRVCEEPLGFVRFHRLDGRPIVVAEYVCRLGHVLHVELPGERAVT